MMVKAANLETVKEWVNTNRPDLAPYLEQMYHSEAIALLMGIGFEAGRLYQSRRKESDKYAVLDDNYCIIDNTQLN